jgi:hypothetical protein
MAAYPKIPNAKKNKKSFKIAYAHKPGYYFAVFRIST